MEEPLNRYYSYEEERIISKRFVLLSAAIWSKTPENARSVYFSEVLKRNLKAYFFVNDFNS